MINSYTIFGTASDTTSGIKRVEYSLDNSNWTSVNGTDNWSKTVDLTSLPEGSNLIYFRATDKADNTTLSNSRNNFV